MPDGSGRLQLPDEMNVFQAEVGSDERLMTRRNLDRRAVVTDADYPRCAASAPANAADQSFFSKEQDKAIIADKFSAS